MDAKKPGPAQTSWAPNKATFMSIGGLEFEKKLFKLSNFSEKDSIDKLSEPRVREAYAWRADKSWFTINFRKANSQCHRCSIMSLM